MVSNHNHNHNHNEQVDDDILQCKADVLRAQDIIPGTPPSKQKTGKKPKTQKTGEATTGSADTAESAIAHRQKSEIPKFDLAEEIMAEQRRITAIKRKSPTQKIKAQDQKLQVKSVGHTIEQPKLSEQDEIITEIVARDIEKLCRGDYSSNSKWKSQTP